MRWVRFPPFGFEFSEFGLGELFLALFLAFFDKQKKTVSGRTVQKDAPGPVSPLRVRIGRVWALGAWFGAVFGVFQISVKSGPGLPPPLHVGVILCPTVSLLANRPLYPSGVRVHCTV